MPTPTKLKSLKPSMREHKRYLYLKGEFTREDVERAIMDFIGTLGYAKANPMWISDKILAVNRETVDKVRASFVICEKNIEVVRVSGTIKKLREKMGEKVNKRYTNIKGCLNENNI